MIEPVGTGPARPDVVPQLHAVTEPSPTHPLVPSAGPGAMESAGRPIATVAEAPLAALAADDPVLCGHCGRTASNGLTCIGMCVADSGY
jgi:hypothetical protein